MFNSVGKADIHQQRIKSLLKQRARIMACATFELATLASLEHQLLNHLYALTSDEGSLTLLSTEQKIAIQLFDISPDEFTDKLLELCSTQPDAKDDCIMVSQLLPLSEESQDATPILEQAMAKVENNIDLLVHRFVELGNTNTKAYYQSALNGTFAPDIATAAFLVCHPDLSSTELNKAYEATNFNLAYAALARGIAQNDAKTALFKRFAKTEDPQEKAKLLSLGGLTGDVDWVEPCLIFCQNNPALLYDVLVCYQHKMYLSILIKLMGLAPTAEPAYQVWELLTQQPLQFDSALSQVDDHHNNAPELTMPNLNQAELIRQNILSEPQPCILLGLHFDKHTAAQQLATFGGRAVAHALLLENVLTANMALLHVAMSAGQWQRIHQLMESNNAT